MSIKSTSMRNKSKNWRLQQKINWHQEEIEDEAETEIEGEETMIMETNNNTTNTKIINSKEEEEEEEKDEKAITQ